MALFLPWVSEALVGLIVLLLGLAYFRKNKQKLPPGPRPLPLIGNAHQVGKRPHLTFTKWAKQYGPIVHFKMGTLNAFVISNVDLVNELFAIYGASGRMTTPVIMAFTKGQYGIVNSEGEPWAALRRSSMRKLRDFGFAKRGMEVLIMDEAQALVQYMRKNEGKPIKVHRFFNPPVINSLWNIVTGERYKWEEGAKAKLLEVADQFFRAMSRVTTNAIMFLPILRYIAPGFFGWYDYVNSIENLMDLLQKSIEEHEATLDTKNPRDFMDMILTDVLECTDPNSVFYKETGDKNVMATLLELFIAGSETTSHSLEWAMLYLCKEPNVQRKVQEEIDAVVGSEAVRPSLSDRPKMPYAEATVLEILRMSNVLPFGVPHTMMCDLVFHGYLLPKGSILFSNSYGIHNDVEIWGDPSKFRPERFLNEDRTVCTRHPALLPFSVGKRDCIGAPLAKDTMFLFLTSILQQYNIERDPSTMYLPENNEVIDGMVIGPKPFNIVMKSRAK